MPKKTFYTKEEIANQKNDDVELKPVQKPPLTIKNKIIPENEINIKTELKEDVIIKKEAPRPIRIKRSTRSTLMDADGNKLKKDGTIDRRGEAGKENLKKSRVYQQILENKRLKEFKAPVLTPYPESSDSEAEFETKNIKLELEPDEQPEKPVVSKGTDDFIKKQEAEREMMLNDQIKAMEMENKKLKDSFHYNTHLNRIQSLSTNVKLKF
jgi:hypothetical protein